MLIPKELCRYTIHHSFPGERMGTNKMRRWRHHRHDQLGRSAARSRSYGAARTAYLPRWRVKQQFCMEEAGAPPGRRHRLCLDEDEVTRPGVLTGRGYHTVENKDDFVMLMSGALRGPAGQKCRGQGKVSAMNPPREVVALPGQRRKLYRKRLHGLDY